MSDQPIQSIVIAGGGTAGWMTAAAISRHFGKIIKVTLVESDDIPTVGVGEATIPSLHIFHDLLKINEAEFMTATNATFKLGISFEGWKDVAQDYIHSFGSLGKGCWAADFQHFWLRGKQLGIVSEIGDYCPEYVACKRQKFAVFPKQDRNHAFHLDAGLYAKFLRKLSEKNGIHRIEGRIESVELNKDNGHIKALKLTSGDLIEGDLFIDCTGFSGLLIEGALHTGYEDWSHWLPCDSAVAVQSDFVEHIPYTRSIARENGWQWRIPLQNRAGNGLVYCSKYWSDQEAIDILMDNISGNPINQPRVIKYRTGTRRKQWNKNCVAIGLSSGFIEPLESTSIHLIQQSIVRFLQWLPSKDMEQSNIDKFNSQMSFEIENIRDFIILHYNATERDDSAFWRYCNGMDIPNSLKQRMDLFKASGDTYKGDNELFGDSSWVQVMLGQGLLPKKYHRIVDMMGADELGQFLESIKSSISTKVDSLPDHFEFVKGYCAIKKEGRNV